MARGPATRQHKLEFRLLGPLDVRDEDGLIALGTPQQRALLAVLLLHANEVVSRDRLIDELWGESPPETAAKLVQVYVSRLRKALEPDRAGGVLAMGVAAFGGLALTNRRRPTSSRVPAVTS